ncbi:unnamed protein product [Durusdinium trenchii]|uniref:Uncharacterized protein n=1 Tax=Durusdinium trenchii TaxID=1381693 RepID=A0ABP0Q2V9_9DINO
MPTCGRNTAQCWALGAGAHDAWYYIGHRPCLFASFQMETLRISFSGIYSVMSGSSIFTVLDSDHFACCVHTTKGRSKGRKRRKNRQKRLIRAELSGSGLDGLKIPLVALARPSEGRWVLIVSC